MYFERQVIILTLGVYNLNVGDALVKDHHLLPIFPWSPTWKKRRKKRITTYFHTQQTPKNLQNHTTRNAILSQTGKQAGDPRQHSKRTEPLRRKNQGRATESHYQPSSQCRNSKGILRREMLCHCRGRVQPNEPEHGPTPPVSNIGPFESGDGRSQGHSAAPRKLELG